MNLGFKPSQSGPYLIPIGVQITREINHRQPKKTTFTVIIHSQGVQKRLERPSIGTSFE